MTGPHERAIGKLELAAKTRDGMRAMLAMARAEVVTAIEAADRAGVPRSEIAKAAGMRPSRLDRMLGQRQPSAKPKRR